jgi:helix-turn-helix protein
MPNETKDGELAEFAVLQPLTPKGAIKMDTSKVTVEPRYLDAENAAAWLGIGKTTLYEERMAGRIKPCLFRGAVRYAVRELERYAKACEGKQRAKAVGPASR